MARPIARSRNSGLTHKQRVRVALFRFSAKPSGRHIGLRRQRHAGGFVPTARLNMSRISDRRLTTGMRANPELKAPRTHYYGGGR